MLNKNKKSNELDFYYLSKDNKKNRAKKKRPKKPLKKKNPEPINDDMFDIDNEIVIGVTVRPNQKKNTNKNKKINNKKQKKKTNTRIKNNTNKSNTQVNRNREFDISDYDNVRQNSKNNIKKKKRISPEKQRKLEEKRRKRNKIIKSILKLLLLLAIIVGIILFLFMSPVFNIKEININGNKRIDSNEIISLSQIHNDENIFKISKNSVKESIKENPYIDSVEIKRKLPNKIEIQIIERTPKYMIEFGNGFVYLNEQGYMLEISANNISIPILTGYSTSLNELNPGNRLNSDDLEKLATVIKIMDSAELNEIDTLITKINISDKENYVLELSNKGKVVYLGNGTSINDRILILKEILTKEEGHNGEVFINDLDKVFFREKV